MTDREMLARASVMLVRHRSVLDEIREEIAKGCMDDARVGLKTLIQEQTTDLCEIIAHLEEEGMTQPAERECHGCGECSELGHTQPAERRPQQMTCDCCDARVPTEQGPCALCRKIMARIEKPKLFRCCDPNCPGTLTPPSMVSHIGMCKS